MQHAVAHRGFGRHLPSKRKIHRRRFGVDYTQYTRLRDGRRARIVALRANHAARLMAGFERLSTESRYTRFMSPKRQLTLGELRYFTQLDGEHHYALAVEVDTGAGWDGAGVARIVQCAQEPKRVEIAVTILDEYQGLGIGTLLVDRLFDAAVERDYREIGADVLAENTAMLTVFRKVAPDLLVEGYDGGSLRLVMPLHARRRRTRLGRLRPAA